MSCAPALAASIRGEPAASEILLAVWVKAAPPWRLSRQRGHEREKAFAIF